MSPRTAAPGDTSFPAELIGHDISALHTPLSRGLELMPQVHPDLVRGENA